MYDLLVTGWVPAPAGRAAAAAAGPLEGLLGSMVGVIGELPAAFQMFDCRTVDSIACG
jgi:hypothetical protein